MICEECDKPDSKGRLGFEGDPPEDAIFLVTIVGPEGAAEENTPQVLCGNHARLMGEGLIGYGWSVHFDRLPEGDIYIEPELFKILGAGVSPLEAQVAQRILAREHRRHVSSLLRGTGNDPTGC